MTQDSDLRKQIKEVLSIVEGDNAYPIEKAEEECTNQILKITDKWYKDAGYVKLPDGEYTVKFRKVKPWTRLNY